jgi:hypothetical protein
VAAVLGQPALNRALLARQGLLERTRVAALEIPHAVVHDLLGFLAPAAADPRVALPA